MNIHDEITAAHIRKIEAERDEAIEEAGSLQLDLDEARETITDLLVELRRIRADREVTPLEVVPG